MTDLPSLLGGIDIYLLDQVLRGRIAPGDRIFDAGCGGGRNVAYFLRSGNPVAGVDEDPRAVAAVRRLAAELRPELAADAFRAEPIEANSFPVGSADVVVASAVLHFARDPDHFRAMVDGCWRLLAPGGLFFARLASKIGMAEERFEPLGDPADRRYRLPDGSVRYLVDADELVALTTELGGTLLDPLKTTVVQDLRCMTTWVVRKGDG